MAGLVIAGFSLTSLTGCMEVTEPTTVATEGQIQNSPSSAESFLMAMPANFNKVSTSLVDASWHFPFGYGAVMYVRDLMTGDLLQSTKTMPTTFTFGHRTSIRVMAMCSDSTSVPIIITLS